MTRYENDNRGATSDYTDYYEITLDPITPEDPEYVVFIGYDTYSEYVPHGPITLYASINYAMYHSSNTYDMATYYRIAYVSFSYPYINSSYSLTKTNINIQNNGMSENAGVLYQSKSKDFTSTSGTLAGYQNWIPTCSLPPAYTGAFIETTLNYSGNTIVYNWYKTFD